MTTPITELSLTDLFDEAAATYGAEAEDREAELRAALKGRFDLSNAVCLAQDMVNRAEGRSDATPEHWKEAQGELTRLRRDLWEAEGEILMLRAELERRVRRVRTGGAT